jgi:uncharacterized membrane protein
MKKISFALASLTVVLLIFCSPGVAYADVNDFVINNFDADYTLSRDDPQGHLNVNEIIELDFSDQNHGILRALPNRYKNHRLQLNVDAVSSASGAPSQYTTYQSGGNTVLKIGDPNRTVTGQQSYNIAYSMNNVIGFYPDHDELYWDINGDQWGQPFEQVSARLHLPSGLTLSKHELLCYTGRFGGTDRSCAISYDKASSSVFAQTTRPLQPYEALSIVVGFEKGYFQPSSWYDTAGEYVGTAAKFLIPIFLIGGTAGLHWWRYGRDPRGKGVIVPHYEAPDRLKPIEVGTVADFRTDHRDITATFIDLAVRGYLKIIETTNELRFRKDTKSYSLQLIKTDFTKLDEREKELVDAVFSKRIKGETVDLGQLKYKLSGAASELQTSVKADLVASGYLRKTPLSVTLKFAGLLLLEFVAMIIFAVISQGGAVVLGLIAGAVLAVIFIVLMPSRTPKGVEAKEAILGLKMYMEIAESERIKKLQAPDAPYAAKSPQPKKTVELFEKLLPYAIVLGVEDKWAAKFQDIYKSPPDWYSGNMSAFSAGYLVSSLGGVSSSVNTAFSSPSSSSGSGFSGGSSGGGGGGGGGGGW